MNIVIWGITGMWIQNISHEPNLAAAMLMGLVLWQIVFRINIETAKGLYEEFIDGNIVNLFSTPLTWLEWVVAMMGIGLLNVLLVLVTSGVTVWILYGISLLYLGWSLIPFVVCLLVSAWCIGFFICGLLIFWGSKVTDYLYTIGYIFLPLSAVYYPVAALPYFIQKISYLLPTTPIFEAMRELLKSGTYAPEHLFKSFILNGVYLTCSLVFFAYMFMRSKAKGLGRLD
jgi:ABC-2 type transport system permease protein